MLECDIGQLPTSICQSKLNLVLHIGRQQRKPTRLLDSFFGGGYAALALFEQSDAILEIKVLHRLLDFTRIAGLSHLIIILLKKFNSNYLFFSRKPIIY